MDAARTAYRLVGESGKVTIVYRRTIKQMPADLGEIKAVLEEGMEIVQLAAPVKIITKDNQVEALLCRKMELGEKDESGRASVKEIPNSDFEITADTIIPAIGQNLDIDFASSEDLKTKEPSYQTLIPKVYIGGDALRGASTAINAIGDGRKAAKEILSNLQLAYAESEESTRKAHSTEELMLKKAKRVPAQSPIETSLSDRRNFKLVSTTLTQKQAMEEASRCLLCDEVCNICTTLCPNLALYAYQIAPLNLRLPNLEVVNGDPILSKAFDFKVDQKEQILHIADWCNQCGNCNTFCPSSGAPYQEKPHLYLTVKEFEKEKDGCFINEVQELLFYKNKELHKLIQLEDAFVFSSEKFQLQLNKDFEILKIDIQEKANFGIDLSIAAQMSLLLKGAQQFNGIKNTI